MKLYIPKIGDKIVLTEDWSFTLHSERRNFSMFDFLDLDPSKCSKSIKTPDPWIPKIGVEDVTVPAGTELIVDRVYIRKGNDEFSSITFVIDQKISAQVREGYSYGGRKVGAPTGKVRKTKPRFWVKLSDVNTIEYEKISE